MPYLWSGPKGTTTMQHGFDTTIRTRILAAAILAIAGACSDADLGSPSPPGSPVAWTVERDSFGDAIRITPATALNGGSVYGVIATTAIQDGTGGALGRSGAFSERAGLATATPTGPIALYQDDPAAVGNPYPEERLVRPDGTIQVPDRYVMRGVGDSAKLEAARIALRRGANQLEKLRGFSTTAPIRIALSAPTDLATVTPETLILFERADGGLDLEGLLRAGEALGIAREDVAIGFSFPTQLIEDDLVSVQAALRARSETLDEQVSFADDDPTDDLALGVFDADDPEFSDFLRDATSVDRVAVGLVTSPDFRGADGIWNAAWVSGAEPAPENELDFLLTLPAQGSPPYPVVLLQHGFGGDNGLVLELGPALAEFGVASIGINAVSHGRRGSPLDLLRARPFRARDIFRQSIADQMAVLRAIEAGVDVDGDGSPDLDRSRMSYLGISLGGMLGATLVAVEEILPAAVLNVAGGRVAFLGQSVGLRGLVSGELSAEVGLTIDDPDFEIYLQRTLETGQHAMDPVDGLNFARRWFREPFDGVAPHRVLLQEGIGDELVDNASTEALAVAGGLVADTPMSDPGGVSGLWRFDPPGGHGILARDDVQAQAFRFLESEGTEIIDPGE